MRMQGSEKRGPMNNPMTLGPTLWFQPPLIAGALLCS